MTVTFPRRMRRFRVNDSHRVYSVPSARSVVLSFYFYLLFSLSSSALIRFSSCPPLRFVYSAIASIVAFLFIWAVRCIIVLFRYPTRFSLLSLYVLQNTHKTRAHALRLFFLSFERLQSDRSEYLSRELADLSRLKAVSRNQFYSR